MTLLELITAVCNETGLAAPSVVVSNTSRQIVQLLAHANALGRELVEWPDADWRALHEEFTFTTDASGSTALPSDFVKFYGATAWDRTSDRPMYGPDTAQGWQWLKSSNQAGMTHLRYRLLGSTLEYWPATDTGTDCVVDILSRNWVTDGDDSSEKATLTKDNDTCAFRDSLMIAGIKMKFLGSKGMDIAIASRDFERALMSALAQDRGAATLNLAGPDSGGALLGWGNIPDTGYG